jgi:hypothetical protein
MAGFAGTKQILLTTFSILGVAFCVTEENRYAVGIVLVLLAGLVMEYRHKKVSQPSDSSLVIGHALTAYIFISVAVGLIAAGVNLVYKPSQIYPRSTFCLGVFLFVIGIGLLWYAFRVFRRRSCKLSGIRNKQP